MRKGFQMLSVIEARAMKSSAFQRLKMYEEFVSLNPIAKTIMKNSIHRKTDIP